MTYGLISVSTYPKEPQRTRIPHQSNEVLPHQPKSLDCATSSESRTPGPGPTSHRGASKGSRRPRPRCRLGLQLEEGAPGRPRWANHWLAAISSFKFCGIFVWLHFPTRFATWFFGCAVNSGKDQIFCFKSMFQKYFIQPEFQAGPKRIARIAKLPQISTNHIQRKNGVKCFTNDFA